MSSTCDGLSAAATAVADHRPVGRVDGWEVVQLHGELGEPDGAVLTPIDPPSVADVEAALGVLSETPRMLGSPPTRVVEVDPGDTDDVARVAVDVVDGKATSITMVRDIRL